MQNNLSFTAVTKYARFVFKFLSVNRKSKNFESLDLPSFTGLKSWSSIL